MQAAEFFETERVQKIIVFEHNNESIASIDLVEYGSNV